MEFRCAKLFAVTLKYGVYTCKLCYCYMNKNMEFRCAKCFNGTLKTWRLDVQSLLVLW